jgi:hypothetical protein
MAISRSSPVNSHRWRCVKLFSARNTGPISNTFSNPAHAHAICPTKREPRPNGSEVGLLGGVRGVATGASHLLVQLWRLCEARGVVEVRQGEDARPAFAGPGKQLGGVDLDKAPRDQELTTPIATQPLAPARPEAQSLVNPPSLTSLKSMDTPCWMRKMAWLVSVRVSIQR